MVSPDRIKHFVIVRFFPYQRRDFPHDIFDVNFLSEQLVLAKNNALKSLEIQTNKNFELVFVVNHKLLADPKYGFIFSTLRESTTLQLEFVKSNEGVRSGERNLKSDELSQLIKKSFDEYDFVIQSRTDFDDFVYKDVIADTQSKVEECDSILCYGYGNGYMYYDAYCELYHFYTSYMSAGGTGHISAMQSFIMKSSFAKKLPFFGIYNFPHTKIKLAMKDRLEKNGIEFSENMFQQNTTDLAFIYFRHKFSITTRHSRYRKKEQPIEAPNKKYFEEEFGFNYKLKSIK